MGFRNIDLHFLMSSMAEALSFFPMVLRWLHKPSLSHHCPHGDKVLFFLPVSRPVPAGGILLVHLGPSSNQLLWPQGIDGPLSQSVVGHVPES